MYQEVVARRHNGDVVSLLIQRLRETEPSPATPQHCRCGFRLTASRERVLSAIEGQWRTDDALAAMRRCCSCGCEAELLDAQHHGFTEANKESVL